MPRFAGSRHKVFKNTAPLHSILPPPSLFVLALLPLFPLPSSPFNLQPISKSKNRQGQAAARVQGTGRPGMAMQKVMALRDGVLWRGGGHLLSSSHEKKRLVDVLHLVIVGGRGMVKGH